MDLEEVNAGRLSFQEPDHPGEQPLHAEPVLSQNGGVTAGSFA